MPRHVQRAGSGAPQSERKPVVLYASTNKVYGGMEDVRVVETPPAAITTTCRSARPKPSRSISTRPTAAPRAPATSTCAIMPASTACRTVVFRQSCIYGPRQFGVEDQGWVAWFVIAAVTGTPITIYGDGKQVRDMLNVSDLVDAYDAAIKNIDKVRGRGLQHRRWTANTLSIWTEFGPMLEKLLGKPIPGGARRLAPRRPEGVCRGHPQG